MTATRPRRTFVVGGDAQARSEFEVELLTVAVEAWQRASEAAVAGSPDDLLRAGVYLRVVQVVEESLREARGEEVPAP